MRLVYGTILLLTSLSAKPSQSAVAIADPASHVVADTPPAHGSVSDVAEPVVEDSPLPTVELPEPLAYADFSWVPANYGARYRPLSTKYFTGEFRLDAAYHHSLNNPKDNTISGSSEVFRHGELQLTMIGVGGGFSLQKCARALHDPVRHVFPNYATQ